MLDTVAAGEREDEIRAAWLAGHAAWPEVALPHDAFAAFVAGLGPGARDRFAADVYLAAACLAGDPRALAAFDREILSAARGAIAAVDANAAFVDEALQRLRASLLVGDGGAPRVGDYAARGPLRAWVGVAGARAALMLRRARERKRELPLVDADWTTALAQISTVDPELELLKRQYASAFATALHDAVAALEPRLRTALRMSFADGLSIDEIGAVYAVHRATAARWIQRACELLAVQTRALLAERLSLSSTELDRMTALVHSQLEVSVSQLLPAVIE